MVSEASATNYDAINYVVIGLMLLGWTYFDAKVILNLQIEVFSV